MKKLINKIFNRNNKSKKLNLSKFYDFEFLKNNIENLIPFLSYMANSGFASDECIKQKILVTPINYYQPIPDIEIMEERNIWDKVSSLKGINWKPDKYEFFLIELSKYYDEISWNEEKSENNDDFYLNNPSFSYAAAYSLYCMIREKKPKKIIEVGSGFSSKIIRDAILKNEKEEYICQKYVIIDPYSDVDLTSFPSCSEILKQPVELMDPDFFTQLEENDILFIDSSHICKMGSDVNYEIFEILPILKKGVIIHFHDIELPYEYHKRYATTPTFRMFWTESYLLQAFLSFNNDFEIILPLKYLQKNNEKAFKKMFPKYDKNNFLHDIHSISFWIQRI